MPSINSGRNIDFFHVQGGGGGIIDRNLAANKRVFNRSYIYPKHGSSHVSNGGHVIKNYTFNEHA
jgi:hypothetical protein